MTDYEDLLIYSKVCGVTGNEMRRWIREVLGFMFLMNVMKRLFSGFYDVRWCIRISN